MTDPPVVHSPEVGAAEGVAARQMMRRATMVGLLMRNCANVIVATVSLLDPMWAGSLAGGWLLALLAFWSLYRIATRSQRGVFVAVDYLLVLCVCAAIPAIAAGPAFYTHNSAPVAIAGTGVISFAVALPARVTMPMTVGVAATFAAGSAATVGWANVSEIFNLYYFAFQWTTAALVRLMLLRVAAAVDRARDDRLAAELNQQVTTAVREYEREQLALLHDTAASTLLIVGQGASLPRERLAAQARRDLELLDHNSWVAPPPRVELVCALRQCAAHLSTPVHFTGLSELWLDGDTATLVIAAAREAMNNVDRHAHASVLTVSVRAGAVVLSDDGVGFDTAAHSDGHGVPDSIIGRMNRAGGDARIDSVPGSGTTTELRWTPAHDRPAAGSAGDPELLIERIRRRYGLVLTAYAVANLAVMAPYSFTGPAHVPVQATLAATALAATLTAVPGIRCGRWGAARLGAVALLVVTVAQPLLLPVQELGGQQHWMQGAGGWCLLPLVLGSAARRAAGLLAGYWIAGAAAELARDDSAAIMVNIGLGSASILGVQLFALAFNALMRSAAADAQVETETHQRSLARERVSSALRTEYQNRFARLVDNIVPLLRKLSGCGAVDEDLQRRARAESRRLRVLFDQASAFDHPMMQRLRRSVDHAAARNVDVAVDLANELPPLTDSEIESLLGPLASVLGVATESARIVLSTSADELTASIVTHGTVDSARLAATFTEAAGVEVITTDDTMWLLVRHPLREGAQQHALAG